MNARTPIPYIPRPSGLERAILCPASLSLEATFPNEESAAAAEGTLAHALFEVCNATGYDVADIQDGHIAGLAWSDEMRGHVQAALDRVREFKADVIKAEVALDLSTWVPGMVGTADLVRIREGIAYVPDLKYGMHRVHVGPQAFAYALGVDAALGWVYGIDTYVLAIVQPRLDHYEEIEIRRQDLLAWAEEELKPAVARANAPDPEFAPSLNACRYCRARATCRARAEAQIEVAFEMPFGPLTDARLMAPDEIAQVIPKIKEIRAWLADVEGFATAEAMAGRIPGWKTVEGVARRAWAPTALPALMAEIGDAAFERKPIGITAAEKILGKKHPILTEQTVKPAGKPTLAPASDPRPEFVSEGEFTAIVD